MHIKIDGTSYLEPSLNLNIRCNSEGSLLLTIQLDSVHLFESLLNAKTITLADTLTLEVVKQGKVDYDDESQYWIVQTHVRFKEGY